MGRLRIISQSDLAFSSRAEAGGLLAGQLKNFSRQNVVVLGIPRGGIIVAREISSALEAELDVVLSRKLGAPFNPELAIGAISEAGKAFFNEEIISQIDIRSSYIEKEMAAQVSEIKRRIEIYRKVRPKAVLKDKVVIITDDGVATGSTMQAALWSARQEQPKSLIAALPVGPKDSLQRIAEDADELICLRVPPFFSAVGQFYLDFAQVTDEEVTEILRREFEERRAKADRDE